MSDKVIAGLFDGDLWEKYVNLAKAYKAGYCIRQSTYTMQIISPYVNRRFMQNLMSNKAFAAFRKIKADIKNNNIATPDIDRRKLEYYKFEVPEKLLRAKHTVYNIDIKSAYATSLLNAGFITEDTYKYMARLPKQDRLACVGMLASNTNYFLYNENAELTAIENDLNDHAPFFFYCIYDVQKTMNEIKNKIGNDFLFYWVDGVYLNSEKSIPIVEEILQAHNFKYTIEVLTEFKVLDNKNRLALTFYKSDGKKKIFRVPKYNTNVNKRLIEMLSLHDENSREIKKFREIPGYLKLIK